MNNMKIALTLEDCITLNNAGYEVTINDGLTYVNSNNIDSNILDELATISQ